MRKLLVRAFPFVAAASMALAQSTGGGDLPFEPQQIATKVLTYLAAIVGAGVLILGATIGISAAWRFARRYLKG